MRLPLAAVGFVAGIGYIGPAEADEEQLLSREEIYARAAITELWVPQPPLVSPGELPGAPPSDAIVLFDGTSLAAWESVQGEPAQWQVEDGVLVVMPGAGDIRTKQAFSNVQLHIEWATPAEISGESQGRGNSGIFLMERYELQILDSFDNPTYPNGQAASIYKQHIPLVNAALAAGEWQSYDIIFSAPVFGEGGRVVRPAAFTVLHNGVLVQNHVVLQGPTVFIVAPQDQPHGAAPIRLQDHTNPVRFRNIWVRAL
jgi:membrane-associated protease RseP (regulator of RpoE activity)